MSLAELSVVKFNMLLCSGHISDPMGEVDDKDVEYKPMVVVRTIQPWHTKISRLASDQILLQK